MRLRLGLIVTAYVPPVNMPAIVTAIIGSDGTILATGFPPGGIPIPLGELEYDPEKHADTWHWPEP
jgi:hypothetical protein